MVENDSVYSTRERTEYLSLLRKRAIFAPLELVVDSRRMSPQSELAATAPDFTMGQPILTAPLLLTHFCLEEQPLERHLQKAKRGLLTDPLRSLEFFLFRPEPRVSPTTGHLHLEFHYQDEKKNEKSIKRVMKGSAFFEVFTRYGVVCLAKQRSSYIGGTLHVPCDGAKSDLTGLSIESGGRPPNLAAYLDRLERELLRHRSSPHLYNAEWGRIGAGFGMAGAAATAIAWPLASTLGSLAMLKIFASVGALGGGSQTMMGMDTEEHRKSVVRELRSLRRHLDW